MTASTIKRLSGLIEWQIASNLTVALRYPTQPPFRLIYRYTRAVASAAPRRGICAVLRQLASVAVFSLDLRQALLLAIYAVICNSTVVLLFLPLVWAWGLADMSNGVSLCHSFWH